MSSGTGGQRRFRWASGPVVTVAIVGALALMAFGYGFGHSAVTRAQASPAASPTSTACTAPSSPAAASPAAASPAASPAAVLNGTPAASDTATAVTNAVNNFAACWNAQNIDALVALGTSNYLANNWAAASPNAAKTAMAPLTALMPEMKITSIGDVQEYSDGRVSAEVVSQLGAYQFQDERWYFTMSGSQLLLDQVETLPTGPEGDTSIIGVTIDPTAKQPLAPSSDSSAAFPVLGFHFQSSDSKVHVVWVLSLPAGAVGTPVSSTVPTGAGFVGLAAVPSGNSNNPGNEAIWLTNLGPGDYVLTDLSTPGYNAPFTVTAPVPVATPVTGTPASTTGTPAA